MRRDPLIKIPRKIQSASKVIGYFSYTDDNQVCCDGDACIIGGSREEMESYLQKMPSGAGRDFIKKTRFGEIIKGLGAGGVYAFDQDAYRRFYSLAKKNHINGLPDNDFFSGSVEALHFIRIQVME